MQKNLYQSHNWLRWELDKIQPKNNQLVYVLIDLHTVRLARYKTFGTPTGPAGELKYLNEVPPEIGLCIGWLPRWENSFRTAMDQKLIEADRLAISCA